MTAAGRKGTLAAFHWVLGLFLLYASATTAWNAVRYGGGRFERHAAVLAAVEGVGAVLFLIPRTLRAGAIILLATIGIAFLVHLAFREARVDLLVYAAGVALVLAERPFNAQR